MLFYLTIKTSADVTPPSLDQEFEGPVVKFGRGEINDIVLPDVRRLISTRHAEIRSVQDQFVLEDVGSTNGSELNGERLEAGNTYPLVQGDEIGIGQYVFVFHLVAMSEPSTEVPDDPDATICLSSASSRYELVVEQLQTLSRNLMDQEPKERIAALKNFLSDVLTGFDPPDADRLLDYVEATFPDPEYQQAQILDALHSPVNDLRHQESISSRPVSQSAVNAQRVDALLPVFLQALTDALNARRTFQQEMEVEVTRILSKDRNPIKWAESSQDIEAYLFDNQRSDAEFEVVLSHLREALHDLALQPMGMMAGLRECVRGILRQLDPETFELEATRSTMGLSSLLPHALNKGLAWDRYSKKHHLLLNEESKTMKHVLSEDFVKGYLSVYSQ